jgi:aerobactin synthase
MTFLAALAEKAHLTCREWLQDYTRAVIIPLYHLQLKYGVGVVAHGQNIVLRTLHGAPTGLVLKDYHGDVRLSSQHEASHRIFFPRTHAHLPQLPPEHLIHDLITGHFITLLRFLSRALAASGALEEKIFYRTIAECLEDYHARHPELASDRANLLRPTFQRVLVNKVRFQIGYGDHAARPLPLLGSELRNPLRGTLP